MPLFEVRWNSTGKAVIEADDPQEAEDILRDGLEDFETTMFESVGYDAIDVFSNGEVQPT